jgi:O-antigen/teichoic acid export membrane protein
VQLSQKKVGIILSYFTLISNVILKFIYTPFLLKNLGQQEYGLYSLVISIIGYLTILDMGFGSAIVRFTIKYKAEKNIEKLHSLYGMMSIIYLFIGFVALVISFFLYYNIENIFNATMTADEIGKAKIMVLLAGINLFFSFPLQISSSILIAYERFIFKNAINLIKVLIVPLLMIFFIIAFDIKSVGLIVIISFFNFLTYLFYYSYAYKKLDFKLKIRQFDFSVLKSIISFSFTMFLLMIFEQLQFNSGQIILGIYRGTNDIAIWGITMIFILNFRSISTAITNIFSPSLMENIFNKNEHNIGRIIFKITRIQTLVLLLTFLNFFLFGRFFIQIWAGEQYTVAYNSSLIIMLPMFFALLLDFTYVIQIARNNLIYRVISLFSGFVISFIVMLSLTEFSIINYAITICLSITIGQIILMLYYLVFIVKLDIIGLFKDLLNFSKYPIIFSILYYTLLNQLVFTYNNDSLILKFSFFLVYNIILISIFWFYSLSSEERYSIKKFRIN